MIASVLFGCTEEKEYQTLGVLDAMSELVLISRETNVFMASPVRVQAYRDQIIKRELANVQPDSFPQCSFQAVTDTLALGGKILYWIPPVGKAKEKPLKFPSAHDQDSNSKPVSHLQVRGVGDGRDEN